MKKQLIALSAFLILLASCEVKKTDTTDNEAMEKNLVATTEINKAIQSGDVSKLDQYIASDAVDHASPVGDVRGIDSIKSMLGRIHTMSTNMKMENIKTVADGDYVFQWMRLTGTTTTVDMGMPAGSNYDINAVQVTKFTNGKLVEHWEFMQPADMAKMMEPQDVQQSMSIPRTDSSTKP